MELTRRAQDSNKNSAHLILIVVEDHGACGEDDVEDGLAVALEHDVVEEVEVGGGADLGAARHRVAVGSFDWLHRELSAHLLHEVVDEIVVVVVKVVHDGDDRVEGHVDFLEEPAGLVGCEVRGSKEGVDSRLVERVGDPAPKDGVVRSEDGGPDQGCDVLVGDANAGEDLELVVDAPARHSRGGGDIDEDGLGDGWEVLGPGEEKLGSRAILGVDGEGRRVVANGVEFPVVLQDVGEHDLQHEFDGLGIGNVRGHAHDLGPDHFGAEDGAEVRVGSGKNNNGVRAGSK